LQREREALGVLGTCEAHQRIFPLHRHTQRERERERERERYGEFWVCVKLTREFFLAARERVLGVCEARQRIFPCTEREREERERERERERGFGCV